MVTLAELPQLPAQPMLIAAVAAFLGSVYLVWKVVGAAIKLFFFVVAFAVGYAVAYALGQFGGHPQALWVYAGEALAFAWAINLIRARVARAVVGFAILGLGQVTGWFGFAPKAAPDSTADQQPTHAKKAPGHPT
jgi:hypothetical protein